MSQNDEKSFHDEIQLFQAEAANLGRYLHIDASVRADYAREIEKMSRNMIEQIQLNKMTWAEAAKKSQKLRNEVMETMRGRSTSIGRAIAENLKLQGKGLTDLIIEKYMKVHHGVTVRVRNLSTLEQKKIYANFEKSPTPIKNEVYKEIVKSAGTPRPLKIAGIDIRHWGTAGRGLIVISVALSVHTIANAEDKVRATVREVAITGSGIVGGIATGAVAGLVCGPAAPACVAAGVFIGGALAAFGVSSWFW